MTTRRYESQQPLFEMIVRFHDLPAEMRSQIVSLLAGHFYEQIQIQRNPLTERREYEDERQQD